MKTTKCRCGKTILLDDDLLTWFEGLNYYCDLNALRVGHVNVATLILNQGESLLPDHIDRNKHNIQRSNLRAATSTQNCQNRSRSSQNESGYKGVRPTKYARNKTVSSYQARIQ